MCVHFTLFYSIHWSISNQYIKHTTHFTWQCIFTDAYIVNIENKNQKKSIISYQLQNSLNQLNKLCNFRQNKILPKKHMKNLKMYTSMYEPLQRFIRLRIIVKWIYRICSSFFKEPRSSHSAEPRYLETVEFLISNQ